MIFKSITLNNFRQYKGKQVIEFSTDPEKNVTVIVGVNTSGKTTLIQAFLWCLYDQCNFKTKDLINSEVVNSMIAGSEAFVSVRIVLFHDNREYTVSRELRYYCDSTYGIKKGFSQFSLAYKDDMGATHQISGEEKNRVINKILPQDLSDYFFFDGERIEEINDKKNVEASVRGLMGLDILGDAVNHLKPDSSTSVIGRLSRSLDTASDARAEQAKKRASQLDKTIQDCETRLITVRDEIEYFKVQKKQYGDQLRSCEDVRGLQERRAQIDKQLQTNSRLAAESTKRIFDDFGKGYFAFFVGPLMGKAISILKSTKKDAEGIPEMHAKAIEYILNRGKCICGCDLTTNEEARAHIEYEKSLLPPAHIGRVIHDFISDCERYDSSALDCLANIDRDFKNLRLIENGKSDLEDDMKNIEKQITIRGNINVAEIDRRYRDAERQLNDKTRLEGSLLNQISMARQERNNLQSTIGQLAIASETNARIRRTIEYAKATYEWFKKEYDLQEKQVRDALTTSINTIFEKMYHGKRKVEIDQKYRIKLLTQVGDASISTDESKGLEAVKNFSFISGLVELARKKARSSADGILPDVDNLMTTEPYPIVMDAPFSNVDEIHIGNISSILPAVAEQVVLIVMKKDWQFAKIGMEDKVGKRYIIEKTDNRDTCSEIKEVENV